MVPVMPDDSLPITIRDAQPGDERDIFSLIRELARFEHLEHQLEGSAEELGRQLFGPSPGAWALVALMGDRIVGYALCFSTFSTFLTRRGVWLEDLFVTESMRRRGIGSALFDAVVEGAQKLQAGRVEWSVLDWNEKAIAFYQSRGAQVLPDWRICRLGDIKTSSPPSLSSQPEP
jgi:GNAT superfamily N-acetyltransferase